MPISELPIANGFYESRSLPLSAQQCVNWFPSNPQAPALSDGVLFGTPGLTQLATTGEIGQVNRGAHVKNGIPYFVNGSSLYRLDRTVNPDQTESFSATTLGTVTGSGRVSMADNGTQLMILVPGGDGFIYNEDAGTPFQQITDPDFTANGNPQYVTFVDSYFAVTTDTKKWIISAPNDGLSWNALDFGSAEVDPDVTVAPVTSRNQLFITGSETTEGFQNAPNGAGFPFIRSNLFLDKGCFAPFTLVQVNNTFMMIGGGTNESPAVWMFAGSSFQKVSTIAIDNALSDFTQDEISNAYAVQYADAGHQFVCFTIDAKTFCFDMTSGRWHERSSVINKQDLQWRVASVVTAYGRLLCGDTQDGRIGEVSDSVYTEYGEVIKRIFATQPFASLGNSIRVPQLELTVESGVGNSARKDPQISMDISDDGKTFTYERSRGLGKIGEYKRRAIWYKNGRAPRFRVLRFKMSDPVKPVIIKLEAKHA
jgi:Phage stabilisation protein.